MRRHDRHDLCRPDRSCYFGTSTCQTGHLQGRCQRCGQPSVWFDDECPATEPGVDRETPGFRAAVLEPWRLPTTTDLSRAPRTA